MRIGLFLIGMICVGQTTVNLGRQGVNADFSNFSYTYPFKIGTTLPSTCTVGMQFWKSNATAGQNIYSCTTTNTWTLEGGAPSGSNTQIQFNNNGIFGGIPVTWNDSAKSLTLTANVTGVLPGFHSTNTSATGYNGFYSLSNHGDIFLEQSGSGVTSTDLGDMPNNGVVISEANSNGLTLLSAGTGPIRLGASGVDYDYSFSAEKLRINSNGVIGVGPFPSLTTMDLGIYRNTAGVLEVNNGTAGTFATLISSNIRSGSNSPEGAITATVGSIYGRTNGSTGTTLYVKESGSGNTGWTAISSGSVPGGSSNQFQYQIDGTTFGGAGTSWDNTYINPVMPTGAGAGDLNDISVSGSYTDTANPNAYFTVIITTADTTDKFKWSKNGGTQSAEIDITGMAQLLSDGVSITFVATTGHTAGTQWNIHTGRTILSSNIFIPGSNELDDILDPLVYQSRSGKQLATAFQGDAGQRTISWAAGGNQPFSFSRSSQGTLDVPVDSSNGNGLGTLFYQARVQGSWKTIANTKAVVDTVDGDNSVGHYEIHTTNQEFDFNNDGTITVPAGYTLGGSLTFMNLGTPANGTSLPCTDCTVTSGSDNTCTGGGSGAQAFRINGVWKCVQ